MAVAVRRSVLLFGSSVELNLLHKNRLPGFGRSGPLVVAGGCGTRRCIHISPAEATTILQENEHSEEINQKSVKSFDTNQLASNNPVEDARAEGRSVFTQGTLFSVFDGHGGPSCAQVVAKRLVQYISAAMLPTGVLKELASPSNLPPPEFNLFESWNDNFELVEDLAQLYSKSMHKFIIQLQKRDDKKEFSMEDVLTRAFLHLDEDISNEARLEKVDPRGRVQPESLHVKTLSVALSGSVGCVAHVDEEHLHVASCGDCKAVLGSWNGENESWDTQLLSTDHNAENTKEVERILGEHPESERDSIIRNDRLFGQLAPLRAFGDVRFKWTQADMRDYLVPILGEQTLILSSQTPPYLTAKPDVCYHRLRPQDKFMILATDGLWDLLSPTQAVRLVGEHMFGKVTLKPFQMPLPNTEKVTLGTLNQTLTSRMEAFKLKPLDGNAATHLIRNALGGTEHGIDHQRLSHLLTLPDDTVRLFRDDITATVVFFNTDYLSLRPL